MKITLTLKDTKPPSWQDFYAGKVSHWARSAMKNTALILVNVAIAEAGGIDELPALAFPVRIAYTVYFKDERRRDLSNIMLKCYEDGLVNAGILPDDSTRYVAEMVVRARLDRDKRPWIEIEIEEI